MTNASQMVGQDQRSSLRKAVDDIADGLREWRVWHLLGLNEIKHRYRRSTIGPFWLTLSMGVQAAVMGILFAYLFQSPIDRFLPFLTMSLVLWGFLNATIMDGATTFIASSSFILQSRRPLSIYVFQNLWKNIIIFFHLIVIFFVVAAIYSMFPGWHYLVGLFGLLLFCINLAWASFAAAILAARFRDVQMIIQNAFTVLFWATPILYAPEQLGGGRATQLVQLNPLYHVIEVVRAPMLENIPSATNYYVAGGTAVAGCIFTLFLYARTRARIPYWI